MTDITLKILVADDAPLNLALVQAVANRLGHHVVTAKDGREAVQRYREEAPDLVFMDVMMPVMDGLAAVREIRALPTDRWVPVVFYSALDRIENVIKGLESGGDDYLVKPADLRLLRAKINGYAKAIALQRKLREHAQELARWRQQAEEQTELGRHIMDRLTNAPGLRDPLLKSYLKPADGFSGDLLCATRGPGDVLYLLLADAAGHGLPAALSAMPVTHVFYAMAGKGFSVASIVTELNRKLKELMPVDRFVAATVAAIDFANSTIEVWNGGNPDVLLIGEEGKVLRRWRSRHPPLGILPDRDFSSKTEVQLVQAPSDLLICSDGLVEASAPNGSRFTLEGAVARLSEGVWPDRSQHLIAGLNAHLAGNIPHDDISFLLAHIPIEQKAHLPPSQVGKPQEPMSEWHLNLAYGAQELRYLDVVPMVLGMLTQIRALKPHQSALYLILSELFNNALDHGLLGLDSAIKEEEGGFERYLELRAKRLQTLVDGRIELGFDLHLQQGKALLAIEVKDSGPGFDYRPYLSAAVDPAQRPHGRGIALVRSLCQTLTFIGCGNTVRALYLL